MRSRVLAAVLLAAVALSMPAGGRASSAALEIAAQAWAAGDYVAALTQYLHILDAGASDEAVATIALQTGELFATRELTDDGDAPRFSPDGRYLLFEGGTVPDRITRVLPADGSGAPPTELQGFAAVFSPDGSQVAYLRIPPSPAIARALAAAIAAEPNERAQRTAELDAAVASEARLTIRRLATGSETEIPTGRMQKAALAFGAGGRLLLAAVTADDTSQIYSVAAGTDPVALTSGPGDKVLGGTNADGTIALFTVRGRGRGGARGGNDAVRPATLGIVLVEEARVVTTPGSSPSLSRDGRSVTYIRRDGHDYQVVVAPSRDPAQATVVRSGPPRADAPVLSPDGTRVAYQLMPKEDWEIYVASRDGTDEARVTREIQHDVLPRFLSNDRLIAMIGEPRHRRSHLYDLPSFRRTRLFHNNTVRTIAPEYAWEPSPDGARLLVVSDRDGDTVSPQRGVYLLDLGQRISPDELRSRLRAALRDEEALRARARRLFAPIAAAVRAVTSAASVARVFEYQKALADFDSKHVTRPGNRLAAEYLFKTYASYGYAPEYQAFEYRPRNGPPVQTSNVLATLNGTVNPDLIYVVSSHYDSVAAGPGADDNTSGTAALLEAARLLARRPQPATIVFASFTGEESGLLGSREFVRRARAQQLRIVGVLNNDTVGWTNDHRLDNTIRYASFGIRDVQHAAAMQFSSMITYDARYYRSTDAAAFYETYGDIVGGIGSYPILGSPHYHQPHDVLETINHQLVTEVARTTAASAMLMASSPSPVRGVNAARGPGRNVTVTWTASPERDVSEYIVAWGPSASPEAKQVRVRKAAATLSSVAPGSTVSVKAVNASGLEGWDWARVTVR